MKPDDRKRTRRQPTEPDARRRRRSDAGRLGTGLSHLDWPSDVAIPPRCNDVRQLHLATAISHLDWLSTSRSFG